VAVKRVPLRAHPPPTCREEARPRGGNDQAEDRTITSGIAWRRWRQDRSWRIAAVFVVALGLVVADLVTWIQLDIATVFGFPLVLAAPMRSRRLLWLLAILLTIATFAVYAYQIPPGAFLLHETFFVNRVLDVTDLLLIAVLLHIRMNSAHARETQARLIREQEEKLEAAKASWRLVEVLETERRDLANELHDLVGQNLTALSINLNIVKMGRAASTNAQAGSRLDDSLKLVEETIGNIRNVMMSLRPSVLDDYGLPGVLRWYVEQFNRRTGVPTSVVEQGSPRRLPPAAEETLFRIAQEALGNVARYARAGKVTVTLDRESEGARLTIADDGCGFDPSACKPPAKGRGWGLMIMRERAAALGAELTVASVPGHGTRVIVTLRERASSPVPGALPVGP
jgi:signal transduction histidine kinase